MVAAKMVFVRFWGKVQICSCAVQIWGCSCSLVAAKHTSSYLTVNVNGIIDVFDGERVLNEMSHVDQYGFRHQFSNDENLALHYLCQKLHLHYSARRAVYQSGVSRWHQLLSVTASPLYPPVTNKVALFHRLMRIQ